MVVSVVVMISFVVSWLVVAEVLDNPKMCFLKGRWVGSNLFRYLEGFLVGDPGYFLWVVLRSVVEVSGFGVVTVVDVRESRYYQIR